MTSTKKSRDHLTRRIMEVIRDAREPMTSGTLARHPAIRALNPGEYEVSCVLSYRYRRQTWPFTLGRTKFHGQGGGNYAYYNASRIDPLKPAPHPVEIAPDPVVEPAEVNAVYSEPTQAEAKSITLNIGGVSVRIEVGV